MKKSFIMVLFIVAIILIVFSLFSKQEQSAKQIMLKGTEQGEEITSYSFDSKIEINLDFSEAKIKESNTEINTFPILTLFDFSMPITEKIPLLQKSPSYQFEINGQENKLTKELDANVSTISYIGSIGFPMDFSIRQKENNLYLRIPEPVLKLYPSINKEYLLITIDYLEADEQFKKSMIEVIKSIDEGYFIKANKDEFQLKQGETSEAVTLNITQENIDNIGQETVDQIKLILLEFINQYQFTSELDNTTDKLKFKSLSITNIYNQDGYQSKSVIDFSLDYYSGEYGLITINFNLEQELYDINQKNEFITLPDSQNVINGYDELSGLLKIKD